MEVSNMKNEPKKRSQVQEVIGLLLTKPEDECDDLQVEFPMECKTEPNSDPLTGSSVETLSIATSPPLNISHNAGMLLESGNVIHHSLDENSTTIQLEDGTTAFVQNLTAVDESDSCDATTKFIDGQAVQLEDGSTAFIHTAPREGLQPVQLEDGTMAYLSQTGADLFNGEASSLDLDQLSSTQIGGDNSDDKDLDYKVTIVEATLAEGSTRALAMGEKAFRCPYDGCSRLYTTQHHLKVHERSHTGDRPFKCTECGKAFATGYGLKSHTRVHTGETPYRCASETCTKAFKTSGDLQKHVRTHTGERPFKCPFNGCDRAFTTSNIRKVHIRTHTGERPYICKEGGCGRAFASATNFKNHIRIHTGEKPYICTVQGCNRRFTEYSSLYKHNVVHTHSKPYICNLCGKNYRQTSTLAMHRRTVHGIVESSEDCSLNDTATEDETASIKQEPDCFPEVESFNEPEKKKGQGLELQSIDITHATNIVIQSANLQQDSVMSSALPSRKLPTIVTLQGNNSNQVLQEHPVYAVQLQPDGSLSSTQQIFVVTDPAQLAALQQFAQQAQLQNIIAQADGDAASK